MEPYFFQGLVLPERAQLTLKFEVYFAHVTAGDSCTAKVSVYLNQVAVWVESKHAWNIYDLRNIVKTIIQNHLAMVGYFKGYAYDLELTRVINRSQEIDTVFGIEIPCLEDRGKSIDLNEAMIQVCKKAADPNGVFLHRCFNDLVSSMKHADDTGFYCYRAIESLVHHCSALHRLSTSNKRERWVKFQEVAGCDEATTRAIQEAAKALRHGEPSCITDDEREQLFISTWDVVDGYLKGI